MAVKRRNKSVYISVYSYIIPAFWLKNPVFPGVFVSIIFYKERIPNGKDYRSFRTC